MLPLIKSPGLEIHTESHLSLGRVTGKNLEPGCSRAQSYAALLCSPGGVFAQVASSSPPVGGAFPA